MINSLVSDVQRVPKVLDVNHEPPPAPLRLSSNALCGRGLIALSLLLDEQVLPLVDHVPEPEELEGDVRQDEHCQQSKNTLEGCSDRCRHVLSSNIENCQADRADDHEGARAKQDAEPNVLFQVILPRLVKCAQQNRRDDAALHRLANSNDERMNVELAVVALDIGDRGAALLASGERGQTEPGDDDEQPLRVHVWQAAEHVGLSL